MTSSQPRCRDCEAWATATIEDEYYQNTENAPRRCIVTGVYVLPVCFCRNFALNRSTWRPATTIDDLAKIKKSAEKDGVEIRLRYAPYGNNSHLTPLLISTEPPNYGRAEYCNYNSTRRQIAEMWAVIVNHWDLGTVEWRPAP